MTLKDDSLHFHKQVWHSPNREEIHRVISKLKSSSRGHGNTTYPSPMLGLLLYDQELLRTFDGKAPVDELETWTARELQILFGSHQQVREFNKKCLEPLEGALPAAVGPLNPYEYYPISVPKDKLEISIFAPKDAKDMIANFHKHPAFGVVLENIPPPEHEIDYHRTIPELRQQLLETRPGGTVEWAEEIFMSARFGYAPSPLLKHVGGLLSLHNSLSNLDQLIYQGLFQEDLLRLDRNHIIDFLWTTAGPGRSMWLMHLPDWYMYALEPTDLFFVSVDPPDRQRGYGDFLCNIEKQSIRGMPVAPGILESRILDENLNSYGNILLEK